MSNDFLEELFDGHEGYVYSPIKEQGSWRQVFYHWPNNRQQLIEHIQNYQSREVYLSPALFKSPRISPDTFLGTQLLWTEFDGSVPAEPVIAPSIRIVSSVEGHEHWYWKLNEFVTDRVTIEDYTRRIAYHYGADLSGWDYQQVLRPPDTWNHRRNKPVTVLSRTHTTYPLSAFEILPRPPAAARTDISTVNLPPRDIILAKYRWSHDALELLGKEVKEGARSDALARLAHECVELGLSNEEIYVLLDERATAWHKFDGRTDKQHRIKGLIALIRSKHTVEKEVIQETPVVFRYQDFLATDIRLEWVVKDILPVAGSCVIFGTPGIGKSTLALRIGMAIAGGKPYYLKWLINKRQKVLFISLEMQHAELKQFFEDMELEDSFTQSLQDWFYIWPIGHAYPFDTPDQQNELMKYIDLYGIQLVIIDSLSLAMYGSVKDDDAVKRLNSFLNEDIRKERNCGYMFIHHPRKSVDKDRKLHEQDDVFGSSYIVFNTQTLMSVSKPAGMTHKLSLKLLKNRMAEEDEVTIKRTSNRDFEVISDKASSGETSTDPGGDNLLYGFGKAT